MNHPCHDIIVIGASAGGIEALCELAAQLEPGLPAAVFVAQHLPADSPTALAQVLTRAGPLPAALAEDKAPFHQGNIYVAPPDHHLLVKEDHLRVVQGPRENRARPAVDPLFRSAAVAFGGRVVGVVLTGLLYDGAAGLSAVKRCGGVTVVQDPRDAVHPGMPEHALARVAVDHCVALKDLGALLHRLAHTPVPGRIAVPEDILLEAQIVERAAMPDIEKEARLGTLVPLSCPECGGPLRQLDHDEARRYRCQIGHAFTVGSLLSSHDDAIEQSLWVALRTLEERHNMLEGMARDERRRGRSSSADRYEQRAAESHIHVERLRALLLEAARRDAG